MLFETSQEWHAEKEKEEFGFEQRFRRGGETLSACRLGELVDKERKFHEFPFCKKSWLISLLRER